MPKYHLPIIDRRVVAGGTIEITLGRKSVGGSSEIVEKELPFTPGQYVHIMLPSLIFQDPRGNGRDFSILSSPNNHDVITIAFRISGSGFKKSILEMATGSVVHVSGPWGTFFISGDSSRPVVCIAGGIGITPFLSILRYSYENKLPHRITLLYVSKDEETRAYRKDLDEFSQGNPNISVQYIEGDLTLYELKKIVENEKNALWHVAGPEGMVRFSLASLMEMGVTHDDIHVEEFSGYRSEDSTTSSLHETIVEASVHSFVLKNTSPDVLPKNFKTILDAMNSIAIVSQTDERGNIFYVSDTFIQNSKYSREELIGNNHRVLRSEFHPQAFFDDMWHNYLLKGRVWHGQIKNKAKDDSLYWVDAIIVPVISTKGIITGYVSIQFIITENKINEEKLEIEKKYYQTLSENSVDMVTVIGKDGTVSYASPSFSAILGYNPDELKGKKIFEHMHEDDLPGIKKTFEKVVGEPEETHTVEFRFRHKDGTWRTIEALGKNLLNNPVVNGIVCNCRDITKHKIDEEVLKSKTIQLEEANRLMIGRELRMIELKEELEELKKKFSSP